jgi:hypothetical protein
MKESDHRTVTHSGLALLTGCVAVIAFGGAVGLAAGLFEPGTVTGERLPSGNPALPALVLALVVGVPMTAAAVRAATGRAHTAELAMLAGALLVGLTGAQLLVVRAFSWPQPLVVVAGLVVFATGWRLHGHAPVRATH